jgi:peroxiredoxin Q/BCP
MPIFSRKHPLSVGSPAPDIALPDQSGTVRSLADYRGKKIVLFFYPKDDTPG